MNKQFYFLAFLLFPFLAHAQMQQLNSAEIAAGLAKLSVKGSVLYIAAHPDDENTRLLAYLAKEKQVRTGYLSLTRGDGGQNLIGNEQAELLGLIRTQELLAARKVDGAEQFFTRANDFGFSKTPEESFKIWGKEQILSDVVWVIRKFRPDVIITRFPEDSRAGHGHHSGSAILAREAFTAAADPKRFPEQLKQGVSIWQAKRIVWNTFNFGSTNTTAPDQLKLDVGGYNPLLGKSYGEIAAISRTNHKSQGFGSALQRGEAIEFFSPIAGIPAKTSLFNGVDTVYKNATIDPLLKSIQTAYNVNKPWLSVPALLKLRNMVRKLDFNRELLDELILACAGIYVEVTAPESIYTPYDGKVPVKFQAIMRSSSAIKASFKLIGKTGVELKPNQLLTIADTTTFGYAYLSQPYWLAENHPIGQYKITEPSDSFSIVGSPENLAQPGIEVWLTINGEEIYCYFPVVYKTVDPVKGEKNQVLVIAPKVTTTISEKAYIFNDDTPQSIHVQLKSFTNNAAGTITPVVPEGWKVSPEKLTFNLNKKGEEQQLVFLVTPSREVSNGKIALRTDVGDELIYGGQLVEIRNQNGELTGRATSEGYRKGFAYKTINYDHIPPITLFPEPSATLLKLDLKIAGKRIAYIDGAGDLVADALKQIGYEVTHLTTAQILSNDLSGYDAIVTGVRLYNINEDVKLIQPKLLKYVENGGTLLVQYNVNTNLKTTQIGPYPFKLSNKRVTEEDAKVNFLKPSHPALNYPNKITEKDFEGWVQERGIYFATDIDPKYTAILSMNDTGESPSDGSLLITNFGKGKFVYTSLVFFRELPAGVPGAYRLLANLLAKAQ